SENHGGAEGGRSPPEWMGGLAAAFELVARDGAERAEYGFDHGLAVLSDLCLWVERGWIGAEDAFVQAAHAVAEPSQRLGPRAAAAPASSPLEPGRVLEALVAERRDEARARVRAIAEAEGPAAAGAALLPFAARHLYDYGHGAIFLTKSLELARRF